MTLCGRVTSSGHRYHVLADIDCTAAGITLATGELHAALRVLVSGRLLDAAVAELRGAVAEILAAPDLSWECIAPGHSEIDPCEGLEIDGSGRLEILVRDAAAATPGERVGLRPVTSDDLHLSPVDRAALTSWLQRETRARDLQERGDRVHRAGPPGPAAGAGAQTGGDDAPHAFS